MVIREIPINHDILEWARIEANLSPGRAVSKAHIKDIKSRGKKEGLPSTIRLERWEKGIETPTFTQLENLAKAYRRPVLTFFLSKPPIKQSRIQDFRTIGNKELDSNEFSPEFSALLRQVDAFQVNLHDLLEKTNGKKVAFVGTTIEGKNPIEVAQKIRNDLKYPIEIQKKAGDYDQAFTDIRTKAEEQGIFVLLEGNLGSYHTNIEADIFRGLAISDELAPLAVVNPNDSKAARIFTLIHEFCHIWRGETGVSNWNSLDISKKGTKFQNEAFCDQVAAEFLVPRDDLEKIWQVQISRYSKEDAVERISKYYWVSKVVIARRLLSFEKINAEEYWNFYNLCQEEWRMRKQKLPKEIKIPTKIRIKSKFGNGLLNKVIKATREGKISELDASRLLNIKLNHFTELMI